MNPRKKTQPKPENVLQKAGRRLQKTQMQVSRLSPEEIRHLVHELQVHQIELEMQNEELRDAYHTLEQVRDQYAELFEFSPVGYLLLDENSRILKVNLRFCQLMGATRQDLLTKSFISFLDPKEQILFRRHLNALPPTGTTQMSEVLTLRCTDSPCRIMLESCRETRTGSAEGTRVRIAVLNVKEQEQAQEDLSKSYEVLERQKKELQSLTEQLFHVQEEERERISRELHDDISQRLALLQMKIEMALPSRADPKYQDIIDDVGKISDDIRQLAHRYHPYIIQDLGLENAIRNLIADFIKLKHLPISLSIRNLPRHLPPDLATCVYRVAQESFHNIMKHAQATSIHCKLAVENNGLTVLIQDNGVGFLIPEESSLSFGLVSMKERARHLNGHLIIESAPGKGTKTKLWIPMKKGSPDMSGDPDGIES